MKTPRKALLFSGFALLLVLLTACNSLPSQDFSYRRQSFDARVEGDRGGEALVCDIYCENGVWRTIVYRDPDPLSGITVSIDENGGYRVEKDGISASVDGSSPVLQGLIRPARVLLLDGGEMPDVQSTQRLPEGHRFTVLADGEDAPVTLTLRDGFPIFAAGDGFSFRAEPISPPDSHGH